MKRERTITELIEKHLKRVENAGTSVNALGWILLALTPAYIWLYTYEQAYVYYFALVIGVVVSIFFISTGKYIKKFTGKHIGKLLILNGLFCLLLARGIIPLIVSVQCFMGYYSLKKPIDLTT